MASNYKGLYGIFDKISMEVLSIRPEGTQDANKKFLLTNCVRVPRESPFGNVARLPSRFQRSLCRGGFVHGLFQRFTVVFGKQTAAWLCSQGCDCVARTLK